MIIITIDGIGDYDRLVEVDMRLNDFLKMSPLNGFIKVVSTDNEPILINLKYVIKVEEQVKDTGPVGDITFKKSSRRELTY